MKGEAVTDVSQRLLAEHGGLRGLFRMELRGLAQRELSLISRERDEVPVGPSHVHHRAVLVDKTSQ